MLERRYKQEKELLYSLQKDVLSRVDRYQPKSDTEIQKEFNDAKLAVLGFSKSLGSDAVPEALQQYLSGLALSEDMNDKVWGLNKRWNAKLLVESVIWKTLYRGFLKDPFRIYGPSDDYMVTWRELFEEGQDKDFYPTPSELSEQWRIITAKSLDALCHRDSKLSNDVAIGMKRFLEQSLGPIGYQPEQHKDELNHIITSARKLAKTLSTQKARLRLFLPAIGEHYSTKKVYDHKLEPANKYGDELERGEVLFVVAPGLRKWGDGNGCSLGTVKDVIAAKVLISE
ncbi:hypothetical protein BDD12DRAFT_820870 [Trichophaea hybrida]|nr:hypothetical protein BDD12DRAFT_820870 [Trichophaea hybrida]